MKVERSFPVEAMSQGAGAPCYDSVVNENNEKVVTFSLRYKMQLSHGFLSVRLTGIPFFFLWFLDGGPLGFFFFFLCLV